MKCNIPQFLLDKLNDNNARPKYFPSEMKQFILEYGSFYNYPNIKNLEDNYLISLWFRYMKSGINEIGICEFNGCSEKKAITKLVGRNTFKVSNGCCWNHSNKISLKNTYGVENVFQLESTKIKATKTLMSNLGCENPSQSEIIKARKKETLMNNYGVDHNMKSEIIKKKREKTYIDKYGADNPMKNEVCKQKAKNTSLSNHGTEFASQSTRFKEKVKLTTIRKYGVEHIFQSVETKKKIVIFNITKYGVNHPMKNPIEFERRQKIRFKFKEYIWKTGEISKVQGYEPIVLRELEEKGYTFQDVKTSPTEIPEIIYSIGEKSHRYYPDIFIPKENLIIEVKSEWTMTRNFEINLLKAVATKSQGFDFKLEVR